MKLVSGCFFLASQTFIPVLFAKDDFYKWAWAEKVSLTGLLMGLACVVTDVSEIACVVWRFANKSTLSTSTSSSTGSYVRIVDQMLWRSRCNYKGKLNLTMLTVVFGNARADCEAMMRAFGGSANQE